MDAMATAVDKKEYFTTCSICFETLKKPKHFPCLHSFCEGYIQAFITTTFEKKKGGVHCPMCRLFVLKPEAVNLQEWSTNLPTNHMLVGLIDSDEANSGQKLCAGCGREKETERACSWCVNCGEVLCNACERYHKRNKSSMNHKLVELGDGFSKDELLYHADVFCLEHHGKIVEAFCNDHFTICCSTCVMVKHRKCENVWSIADATAEIKKSKKTEEITEKLEGIKISLEKLCIDRDENLKTFDEDIKTMHSEVETLFKELSDHLDSLKTIMISEIAKAEKEIRPDIENEYSEISCRISAVKHDLTYFQTKLSQAPCAPFLQAMDKLAHQKEILENYVKDRVLKQREIRVAFIANEKLQRLSRDIKEMGKLDVSRTINYELLRSLDIRNNMLKTEPILNSEDKPYHGGEIALLENGQVLISNTRPSWEERYDPYILELYDARCSRVLSFLNLCGYPSKIKMTSAIQGAVVVSGSGLVLFDIQNDQVRKLTEIQANVSDFVYYQCQYFMGQSKKITVYDNENSKVREISLHNEVKCMAVRGDTSLCYAGGHQNHHVYCISLNGNHVFTYSHDKLKSPKGITVDHAGYIYVCGYDSVNVHQLSHDGKLQRSIFDKLSDGPLSICFSTRGDRAVIGCTGKILLYDLKFSL